ncbi:MAG: glycosyltransferase family 4 protein [Patescibacteria group bacterium]
MKILLFSTAYLPFIGGAELAIKEITERLPGIEFDLITAKLKRGLPDFEKIGNVNVYRIGAGNKILDKPLLANLGFLKALNLYKKNKYDLIHGIMASQGSAAAYLFKFIHPKVPFVLTLQEGDLGGNSLFDRFWQRRVVKKADAITVISSYLADFAKKLNKKAPIFVVPNGVDLQKFKIKNEKLKINEKKIIITVSRLVKKNGIDILIKAVRELKNLDYELWIAGDGKEKKKLESLVNKLGLENKVKFLGGIPNEQIPEYLARADLFVRPSRSEGLGSAFLEAMAVGIPIIATPVGGIPDFLRHGETGLFCETENPEDLSEKITKILTDENLKTKIIKNSLGLVRRGYSWDFIAAEMKEIYEKTVSHNSSL